MPVRVPESQLAPQRLDTGNTPALAAAQRRKAVARELAGNGVQRPAGIRQFLDAGTEAGVITPVGVAGKGPYQHAFRLAAPSPGHPHPHLLARALCRDRDLLDHLADQLFAVRIRRRGSVPPRRKSGGELANRRAFLTRQDARLRLEEAVLLFLQRRLRVHLLLPGALQRPGDQAVLRFDRLVLSGGTLRLVGGAFPALLPQLSTSGPLLCDLRGGGAG